jgi:hypothetical protein
VILIQAAIGGSRCAEEIYPGYMGDLVKYYLGDGLTSLTRYQAILNFKAGFNHFLTYLQNNLRDQGQDKVQEAYNTLSSRIFYVRSFIPDDATPSWGVRLVRSFCESAVSRGSPSDGLLNISDQMLNIFSEYGRQFGVDLGILEADHVELVVAGMTSNSNKTTRKAFTRALLKKVFEKPISNSSNDLN